jgi:hypothetical protein
MASAHYRATMREGYSTTRRGALMGQSLSLSILPVGIDSALVKGLSRG